MTSLTRLLIAVSFAFVVHPAFAQDDGRAVPTVWRAKQVHCTSAVKGVRAYNEYAHRSGASHFSAGATVFVPGGKPEWMDVAATFDIKERRLTNKKPRSIEQHSYQKNGMECRITSDVDVVHGCNIDVHAGTFRCDEVCYRESVVQICGHVEATITASSRPNTLQPANY